VEVGSLGIWATNSWFSYTFLVSHHQQYLVFTKVLYIITIDFTIYRYILSKSRCNQPSFFCWSADCVLTPISIYLGNIRQSHVLSFLSPFFHCQTKNVLLLSPSFSMVWRHLWLFCYQRDHLIKSFMAWIFQKEVKIEKSRILFYS
jgi:hypothetical protein